MAAYPDVLTDIKGTIPFNWEVNQKILKTEFENGQESRRLIWQNPRRNTSVQYAALSFDDSRRLYDFYSDVDGPFASFIFVFPQTTAYAREFCGVSDGTEAGINLPSKGAQAYTLYSGTTPITSGNYNFFVSGGPDGEDRLVFSGYIPALGERFYWSFTGRLKNIMRFSEAAVSFSEVKRTAVAIKVNLIGLQAKLE